MSTFTTTEQVKFKKRFYLHARQLYASCIGLTAHFKSI